MKRIIITLAIIMINLNFSFSKEPDTLQVYELPSIHIISQRGIPFVEKHKYGTDYNSNLLNKNGFALVRRGLNFTQDLYVEGFKKGDVKVSIDGEQYHNACPNRMDAPSTRINLMDIESVELTKSSSLTGTGLYGKVEYHRTNLTNDFKLKSMINGSFGASRDYDLSLSGEGLNSSISFRYSSGEPYKNGAGKSFKDLYGYTDNYRYSYLNSAIRHRLNDFNIEFGANFTEAKNISFPYLQMDERSSKVFGAYIKYQTHKIYFNYTDHLMNNELRNSNMFMETKARNLTIGLSNSSYEITYRNWNADNSMKMMTNSINNRLMPDVHQLEVNLSQNYSFDKLKIYFKGGLNFITFRDLTRKFFFEELYRNVKDKRYFISSGISASYSTQLTSDFITGLIADFASNSPDPEQLYIAIKRLMTNPDWSGNPNLSQPYRFGLRSVFNYKFFNLEIYTNYVVNYVDIVKRMKPAKAVMTYENTNALLFGSNLNIKHKLIESNISYLWGENTKTRAPLAEIAPLSIYTTLEIPVYKNLNLSLLHRYENAQKRLNTDLKEFATSAWNTIGIGLNYSWNEIYFDLRVNNLLNHTYYKYLSYSRNPFSAGIPVFEPGRSIDFNVYFKKIF